MSKSHPLRNAVVGVAAGAAAMYVFDPDRGRRRRSMLRDQSRAVARRHYRQANRVLRGRVLDTEHRLQGAVARARGAGHYHPESEVDLREHLHQVIASLDFPTRDVNVEVVKGVATLRGQLATGDQELIVISEVKKVPGVNQVQSFLHLPGTPAPNKEASLHAGE